MQKLLPNTVDEFGDTVASYAEAFNISSNVTINGETYDEIWDVMFPYQILNTDDGIKVNLLVYVELSDREVQLSTRNLNRIKSDKVVYTISKNGVERKILLRVLVAPESVPIAASVKYNGFILQNRGVNEWALVGYPWNLGDNVKGEHKLEIKWWGGDKLIEYDDVPRPIPSQFKFGLNEKSYPFKIYVDQGSFDYPYFVHLEDEFKSLSRLLYVNKDKNEIELGFYYRGKLNIFFHSDAVIDNVELKTTSFSGFKVDERNKNKLVIDYKKNKWYDKLNFDNSVLASFNVITNNITKEWTINLKNVGPYYRFFNVKEDSTNTFLSSESELNFFNFNEHILDLKNFEIPIVKVDKFKDITGSTATQYRSLTTRHVLGGDRNVYLDNFTSFYIIPVSGKLSSKSEIHYSGYKYENVDLYGLAGDRRSYEARVGTYKTWTSGNWKGHHDRWNMEVFYTNIPKVVEHKLSFVYSNNLISEIKKDSNDNDKIIGLIVNPKVIDFDFVDSSQEYLHIATFEKVYEFSPSYKNLFNEDWGRSLKCRNGLNINHCLDINAFVDFPNDNSKMNHVVGGHDQQNLIYSGWAYFKGSTTVYTSLFTKIYIKNPNFK